MTEKYYEQIDGVTVEMSPERVAEWKAITNPPKTIMQQIQELEAQITPRRLREAVLGDNGWLAAKEAEISALREQL